VTRLAFHASSCLQERIYIIESPGTMTGWYRDTKLFSLVDVDDVADVLVLIVGGVDGLPAIVEILVSYS
jgi:hypothetical protein